MGCYDVNCQACGEEHIDGTDVCILETRKIIWAKKGASNISIPVMLPATYGGYGNFTPLDAALGAKVAFCDASAAEACSVAELLETCDVPGVEYLVTVVASSKTCWLAEEEEEDAEDEEEVSEPVAVAEGA